MKLKRSLTHAAQRTRRGALLAFCAGVMIVTAPAAVGLSPVRVQAEAYSPLAIVSQTIVIDGKSAALPTANVDGDTYIGLRSLNEGLGLTTGWNAETRTVTASGRGRTLTVEADTGTYSMNGQLLHGLPAILQDGSVYMPLRFLLELMGYGISYDPASRVIGIETIKENALTIETGTIAEEGDKLSLKVHYPQLAGYADADVQRRINAFLKEEAETHAKWGKGELVGAAAANAEAEAEAGDKRLSIPPVSYEGTYTITYNDKDRLSLYVDYYIYTGGAHGLTIRQPYTFDLLTGKQLSLKEVSKGKADYVAIINDVIRTHIRELDLPMLTPFESIEPERAFFLKNDAVVIYFEQYEYTPYAAGMPEFEVPFDAFGK
ncbi:DUF4163 domain-containing protein [Paenibacillus mesophilus]|uniref:PdaC/SigV domain-containing protein n=1 Tax=Paenibacillus mesophilus TaxID=2582849 RepID=UPI00110F3128|nr:DUF4163 domain-containing protein [Paenibacillus mesophilus]TMV47630.1 DUF4163 domain-containing protein [Paenibacillus mesophilus]